MPPKSQAGRFHHPQGRRARNHLQSGQPGRGAGADEHLPAPGRTGLPGIEGQFEVVPVLLSRLGVRPGWRLRSQPGEASYPVDFRAATPAHVRPATIRRLSRLLLRCFDPDAQSLADYLAGAKEYLDVICDQSDAGMTVVPARRNTRSEPTGTAHRNSIDGYHAATTHASYFDYLMNPTGGFVLDDKGSAGGVGLDLGNGHAVLEYPAPWGRPVARWIPAWGEQGKIEVDKKRAELTEKYGEERARRIAQLNRNLFIFPNLVVNDIMAVNIRTYYPEAPDYMVITAWALAPKEESAWARKYRLSNFLEFLGPGGFATPDDAEALEHCQRGFRNARELQWNDISKGMNKERPRHDDELQMRAFWTQWNKLLFPATAAARQSSAA
jgi:p-cumate 2,3-dioxygenase alpha subunit